MIKETLLQANELLSMGLISQITFDKIVFGLALKSQDKLLTN